MKINKNFKGSEICFSQLTQGDLFIHLMDNSIMMKINPCINEETNSVELETGEGFKMRNATKVIKIEHYDFTIQV